MTKNDRLERNKKIIEYKLAGHTFEETLIWARETYGLGTVGHIQHIWKKYKESQEKNG